MSVRFSLSLLTVLAVAATSAVMAVSPPAAAAPAAPPCTDLASDAPAALALARRCARRVEDVSRRAESSQAFVNADGTTTLELSAQPRRVKNAGGAWVAVDTTLRPAPGGGWQPTASTVDVRFSGGGAGALATVRRNGRTFTLGWPAPLPTPAVTADSATYPDVLPGVDLTVTATVTGFSHVLVVRDAAAAANPALRAIAYDLGGTGVRAERTGQGGVEVRADDGTVLLTAGAAVMWDSKQTTGVARSAGAEPSSFRGAGDYAQRATAETGVAGGRLTLQPDAALLARAEYPLFIDPVFTAPTPTRWAYSNNTNENNDTSTVRMGRSPDNGAVYRPLFEFPVGALIGSRILSATFGIQLYHSYSCGATPVTLWRANGIASTPKNPWANSGVNTYLDTQSAAANKDTCFTANQPTVSFGNLLAGDLQAVANSGWTAYTLALSAMSSAGSGESTSDRWKKFNVGTAVLSVNYNHAPRQPALSDLLIDPSTACTASPAFINAERGVTLLATLSDPNGDNVKAQWQVTGIPAQYLPADSVPAAAGQFSTTIPAAAFTDGASYSWSVRANDNTDAGAYSPNCPFSVDNTLPGTPAAASTDVTLGTGLLVPAAPATAVVGQSAAVTLTKFAADTNVAGYLIGVNGGAEAEPSVWVPARPDGNAVVSVVPVASGSTINYLTVRATDLAGQSSAKMIYKFRANAAAQTFKVAGDGTGDGRADVTVFNDNGGGNSVLWRLDAAAAGGTLRAPKAPQSLATVYNTAGTRTAGGDFDGDGRSDTAVLRQSGTNVELTVQRSTGNQVLGTAVLQTLTGWSVNNLQTVAGDFDGDGRDDLAVANSNGNISWTAWVLLSTSSLGTITFAAPADWYHMNPGGSDLTHIKLLAGDFNGDSRSDLAEFYDYGSAQTKLWAHWSLTSNVFSTSSLLWDSGANAWFWSDSKFVAGDFNGDLKTDIAAFYAPNHTFNLNTGLATFIAKSDGTGPAAPNVKWESGPNLWDWNAIEPQTGDFDADSKADLATVYRCCGAYQTSVQTMTSTGPTFNAPEFRWQGGLGPVGTGNFALDTTATVKYQLVNVNSGKCVDVTASGTVSGTVAQQWTCTPGAANQLFTSVRAGAVNTTLRPTHTTGQCLAVPGASTADQATITTWSCGSVPDQYEQLEYMSGTGTETIYRIRPLHSGKCFGIPAGAVNDGVAVVQWTCNGAADQQWKLRIVP